MLLCSHENNPIKVFPEIKAQAGSPWSHALKWLTLMEEHNPQEHPEIQKGGKKYFF